VKVSDIEIQHNMMDTRKSTFMITCKLGFIMNSNDWKLELMQDFHVEFNLNKCHDLWNKEGSPNASLCILSFITNQYDWKSQLPNDM
jgi:hypothetical protein